MWRRAWAWIFGHTIRAQIAWSFVLIRLILYPSVIVAMIYFFWMASLVNRIAREDARLIRLAELIDVNLLEARKAEKNFALLGDRAYLDQHRDSTGTLRLLMEEGKRFARAEQDFTRIERAQGEYLAAFDKLSAQGPLDQAAIRHAGVGSRLADYRRAVEGDLEAFRNAVRSRRAYDRLQRTLRGRLNALILDLEAFAQGEEPAIPAGLFQRLRRAGDEVQRLAREIAERTWRDLEVHREQAFRLRRTGLWVMSILLAATFCLNTVLTYVLPRRILGPVTELTEACRRVRAGDMAAQVAERRRDELGDLARAFNEMLEALRGRAA